MQPRASGQRTQVGERRAVGEVEAEEPRAGGQRVDVNDRGAAACVEAQQVDHCVHAQGPQARAAAQDQAADRAAAVGAREGGEAGYGDTAREVDRLERLATGGGPERGQVGHPQAPAQIEAAESRAARDRPEVLDGRAAVQVELPERPSALPQRLQRADQGTARQVDLLEARAAAGDLTQPEAPQRHEARAGRQSRGQRLGSKPDAAPRIDRLQPGAVRQAQRVREPDASREMQLAEPVDDAGLDWPQRREAGASAEVEGAETGAAGQGI